MYCIKCGRKCGSGEKRCPDCSTRLITPARLKELIELEKYVNQTFTGKLKIRFKRFRKRWSARLRAAGTALGSFFKKLGIDLAALLLLLCHLLKRCAVRLWPHIKRGAAFAWKYAAIGSKKFLLWAKRAKKKTAAKLKELRQEYRKERDRWQRQQSEKAARERQQGRASSAQSRPSKARTTLSADAAKRRGDDEWYAPARNVQWGAARRSDPPKRTAQHKSAQPARSNAARGTAKAPARRAPAAKRGKTRIKGLFTREWAQEHMRSLVAMGLLAATLIIVAFWGAFTDGGQKTFAQVGLGSARGYMLIGDDYMQQKNYSRAIEYYLESVNKDITYDAALKLAVAYSYTDDRNSEINVLLFCTENYPENKLPFSRLNVLFPGGSTPGSRVQRALDKGIKLYGAL